MNNSIRKKLARGKRRNQYRLRDIEWEDQPRPMFAAGNIQYDLADKTRGLTCGGIGAIHTLARQSGLIDAIDRRLHLLKIHKPYRVQDPDAQFFDPQIVKLVPTIVMALEQDDPPGGR